MSTTVTYKGSTLTTATNQTRTLETAGKYLEDDVTIVDSTPVVSLQTKNKTYTPTTSQQTEAVTADSGYTGLNTVNVTVNAMPTGTAGTPTATKGTVSNHSVTVTPSVTNTTGYITGGTKTGTGVSVSASELVSGTYNVTSSGTKDVTNYASASIPSGTAGTPTATKGTVSNNSVSVTPSVTNTSGYITGSTKTGTAVTVSASELVSGTKSITQNGTGIDVTNYASVNVDVSGGGIGGAYQDQDGYIVLNDSDDGVAITPLTVTQNGTYTASTWQAYSPVTVNVPSESPTLQTKSKTYTPSTSQQTESITADSGYDGLNAVNITVNAMPTGTAGTPTATKGTVSNHSVSVTPSVTNTTGYITGSTKTGTAVTVSASELVSGSETKTANGTYDVTNLASLVVNVPVESHTITITGAGDSTYAYISYNNVKYYSLGDTVDVDDGSTINIAVSYGDSNRIYVNDVVVAGGQYQSANYTYTVTADAEIQFTKSMTASNAYVTELSDIAPLTITQNGTYTASGSTRGYSPVTVNVPTQSTTHTATISRTDGQTIPRAQVNGEGTNYGSDGTTFTWQDGDNIRLYLGSSSYSSTVFINGIVVSNSFGGYYTFTPPKCDIELTFERNTDSETSKAYVNYNHLVIEDRGAYDVSDYFGVSADVASYEIGAWSPNSDVTTATISFTKTHTALPLFVGVIDAGQTESPNDSVVEVSHFIYTSFGGKRIFTGTLNYIFGSSNMCIHENNSYEFSTNRYLSAANLPVTTSGFTVSAPSTKYFRAERTYNWIAIWSPT